MKVSTSTLDNLVKGDRIFIIPQRADTYEANPCKRATCIGARAIDRVCGLGGTGHIKFDANEICFTRKGHRVGFHVPKAALTMLREFDELAQTKGVEYARVNTKLPKRLDLEVMFVKPIPVETAETRAKWTEARHKREASRKAQGLPPRPGGTKPRYVGV